MQKIAELLSRDLSEPIEEVIKLDQQDERTVYKEITEYVATDRIKGQYLQILQAIADAPSDPSEGVGVWVSGFFGSGKSSFAKNLGYILANRKVLGEPAGQVFVKQLQQQSPGDPKVAQIADLVDFVNKRLDTQVIMFDVQVDRAVRRATEPIAEIMYSVLLRELDYAQDFGIAELEMDLEASGRLAAFVQASARLFADQIGQLVIPAGVPCTLEGVNASDYAVWQKVRIGSEKYQRASAALHDIDPATYPSADSWAASLKGESDVTIRQLVDRTFELATRRRPGHTVAFIIDEVGQYVARSVDKIENLRAVVEQFGIESKNRVAAHKATAPVWIIVTSQEKLEEVVAAIDDKRVQLARVQDRFKHRIDMAPGDIREVASRRVLAKKSEAEPVLASLFDSTQAMLRTHTHLERTSRQAATEKAEFIQFYPYLPHYLDLSIDIVTGMRSQPGAPKHIGGSNRTIIKQTYEMLVGPRTALGQEPVGALVTMDRIFDLVEGNLSSEKQRDISDIAQRFGGDPWPVRTAKAIALLEYVRDLPRSEANLAAVLYRKLGDDSPLPAVQRSIELLRQGQFIRQTDSGWKLQTAQEKSWTAERNAHSPSPKEQNDLLEQRLQAVFSDPSLTRYKYRSMRNFHVGVTWNGRIITAGEAQVPLALRIADGPDVFVAAVDQARSDSRERLNETIWVLCRNAEIDETLMELHRSRQMVGKYDQLRAQNKITSEESSSLADEKTRVLQLEVRLTALLESALSAGQGFFRGVGKEGASLGKAPGEVMRAFFDYSVPDLYPKLDMGAKPLPKGTEAEEILKAANLTGLPKVYYAPPDGLALVIPEGNKHVVNAAAPIAKEVADYLAREHSYGNKVTGKMLEDRFGGLGYGWEREMLWLVLATLLRGGAIEVTYQGRRHRNHLDPQVRVPFSGTQAFRSASFAPCKAIDLATLVKAAQQYEAITGEEVDVEETSIGQAFQRLARAELDGLLPVEATVRANNIPLMTDLQDYHATLESILTSASDECVRTLAGEGVSFKQARDTVAAIRKATDEKGLTRLNRARAIIQQAWPLLKAEGKDGGLAEGAKFVEDRLADGSYYKVTADLERELVGLEKAFRQLYSQRHAQRAKAFSDAADAVKAQPSWLQVQEGLREQTIKPLDDRTHRLELGETGLTCQVCHASLAEMASDLTAVDGLRASVLMRVQELTAPEERVQRVRLAQVSGIGQSLSTQAEVDELVDALRDYLLKLVASGVKVMVE